MTVLVWLVVGLVALSAGLVLLLVVLRVTADLRAKRRAHAHAITRDLVLTVLMGEPDEIQVARDKIAKLTGEEGTQAESQIFSYLPKVTGETRTLLVDLVTERGAVGRARALLNSWSARTPLPWRLPARRPAPHRRRTPAGAAAPGPRLPGPPGGAARPRRHRRPGRGGADPAHQRR